MRNIYVRALVEVDFSEKEVYMERLFKHTSNRGKFLVKVLKKV